MKSLCIRFFGLGVLLALIMVAGCRKQDVADSPEEVRQPAEGQPGGVSSSDPGNPGSAHAVSDTPDLPPKEKKLTFLVDRTLPIAITKPVVSPDGKYAISQASKKAKVYRLSDGSLAFEPPIPGGPAIFSPDGHFLCCAYTRGHPRSFGKFRVFDLRTGQKVGEISSHYKNNQFIKLAFSPDGATIYGNISYGVKDGIEAFDFKSRKSLWHNSDSGSYEFLLSNVFHTDPEGKWLFAKSSRKPIGVFSTADGKLVRTLGTPKTYCSLSQGRWLTTQDDQVEIYDTVSLQKVNTRSFDARISENGMADLYFRWSYWQNKNYLIGHCISGVVFIDIDSSELVAEYKRFSANKMSDAIPKEEWIIDVVILPDNETLMICSRADTVLGRLVFE